MIKVLLILSLLSFSALVQCEIPPQFMYVESQPNEFRTIELSTQEIFTSNYSAISADNSSFEQVQPIEFQKSLINLTIFQELSSSELFLSNRQSLKALVYLGEHNGIYLSICSIDGQEEALNSLTKTITFDLSFLNSSKQSVSLVCSNHGILSYSENDKNYIAQFFFYEDRIELEQPQFSNQYSTMISVLPTNENIIQYLSFFNEQQVISLYHIAQDTNTVELITQIKVCLSSQYDSITPFYNNNGVIVIRCRNDFPLISVFEEYSIDYQKQRIVIETSGILDQYQFGEIQNVSFIQNTFYILETFENEPFILQLTTLQKQYKILVQKSARILTIEDTSTFIGQFISKDGNLITIITNSSVVGISIETQFPLFSIPLSSFQIDSFYLHPISAIQFLDQILLCYYDYQNNQPLPSFSIVTHIPTLRYSSPPISTISIDQKYTVSYSNGATQTLIIWSSLYNLNEPPITVKSKYLYESKIGGQQGITVIDDLNERIVGSNLITSTADGQKTKTDSFEPSVFTLSKVDCFINLQTKSSMHSTNREGVIIISNTISESGTNLYEYSYQILAPTSPIGFVKVASFSSTFSYLQMDSSGSLILNSGDEYWTIYFLYLGNSNQFVPILTNCKLSQHFSLSSDPSNSILATFCDNSVAMYDIFYDSSQNKFSFQAYNLECPPPTRHFSQIELYSKGLLVITDNTIVYGFDAINKVFIGCTKVPQADLSLQPFIYLFANSFIYGDDNYLLQFSYNNFQQEYATLLRQLMVCCGVKWIDGNYILGTAVHNSDKNREYFILPTIDNQQNPIALIYKVEQITAQNQFLTVLNFPPSSNHLFTTTSYIGFYDSDQNTIHLYENCLNLCFRLKYSIDPSYFLGVGRCEFPNKIFVVNNRVVSTISLNIIIERSKSSLNDELVNNNQLSSLSTYFLNSPLQDNSVISFKDNDAFKSNLFGWQIPSQLNQFGIEAKITQRMDLQEINSSDYTDMIQILPNLVIYATLRSINCGNITLFNSETDVFISFFIDASYSSDGPQFYQVQVYALIKQSNDESAILLNSYFIKANYSDNVQDIISILATSYAWQNTEIFNDNKLISILTDHTMGLIALFKPRNSRASQVKVLDIDQNTVQIKENADVLTILITAAYYDRVLKKIVFFTLDGFIYYNLANPGETEKINLLQIIREKQIDITKSLLTQVTFLKKTLYLLEFNDSQLFQVRLLYLGGRLYNHSFAYQYGYQADLMRFTGFAFINSQDNIVIACQLKDNLKNFILVLLERKLIKSSAISSIGSNVMDFRFFLSTNQSSIQILVKSADQQKCGLYSLTISDYVTITFQNVNLPDGFFGNAFGISPLFAPCLPSNTVLFQAKSPSKIGMIK